MAEWRRATIGELCDAGIAQLQTGPFGSQLHSYDYVPSGVAVVATEAIREGRIDHSVLPRVTEVKAEELSRHQLRGGDILFARRGAQATGRTAIVRAEEEGFICGTGAIRLRINNRALVAPEFLSFALASAAAVDWLKLHAIGATMPNLNEGIIRSVPLKFPPVVEQHAIAQVLGTLDDKIELNRRMNETLEAMARAIFKSWFVDFDPVRAKAERRDTGLSLHLDSSFSDRLVETELGEIPVGWTIQTIGEIAEVVGGSTPSTVQPIYWDGGEHCWATPKDLAGLSTPVLLETEHRITDAGLSNISSGLLPRGTVLLSSRAPIGYLAVAEIPVAINQGFIAIKPKAGVSNLFLLLWASLASDQIMSRANGSTFLEISKTNFRPIPVAMPNEGLMGLFDQHVRPLYEHMVRNCRESRTLIALRDTLLPKLISGELRLKEAERYIQGAKV